MSDEHNHLTNVEPLGRSVEEVERDSQNLVNPPAQDDAGAGAFGVAAVPPINSTGTWPSQTGIGASTPEVPVGPTVRRQDD